MDVVEELEALEATFSGEIAWKKTENGYSVDFHRENLTVFTLQLDGGFVFSVYVV